METSGFMGATYRGCEWVMRLAYLNVLWISFTLIGLILFGFFPATAAMFGVTNKWVMGEKDIPVFRTFWRIYRSKFVKSNVLMFILTFTAVIFYVDFMILSVLDGWLVKLITVALLTVFINFLVILLNIFPLLAYYEYSTFQYIKYAFLFGVSNPVMTVLLAAIVIIFSLLLIMVTSLLLFFSGSIMSLLMMSIMYRSLKKIDFQYEANKELLN